MADIDISATVQKLADRQAGFGLRPVIREHETLHWIDHPEHGRIAVGSDSVVWKRDNG